MKSIEKQVTNYRATREIKRKPRDGRGMRAESETRRKAKESKGGHLRHKSAGYVVVYTPIIPALGRLRQENH